MSNVNELVGVLPLLTFSGESPSRQMLNNWDVKFGVAFQHLLVGKDVVSSYNSKRFYSASP